MKKRLFFIFFVIASCYAGFAQQHFEVLKNYKVSGSGWWDYIAVYKKNLYISHGTQVNIIDKTTGDSVGIIQNTNGVHGIVFDEELGKGFTSNGKLNNVFVFNLKTNFVTAEIATGNGPDAIMYEPFTKKIITCNGHSNSLSIIDPKSEKVTTTIALTGKPETAVSNNKGLLYINDEDNGKIMVVDLKTNKLVHNWSLNGAEGPTGLIYDANTKRLFAGCDELLVVVDATNGKIISKLKIGGGCDGVAFNSETKTIFTSNGENGTITVIKQISADDYKVIENIATALSARTIIEDPLTHLLYLPAAEFEKNSPAGERPKIIDGSFRVMVIAEKK